MGVTPEQREHDRIAELEAERDRYRELFEAKYSTIRAERDCYREALDTIARMDSGAIARAALHPEEEE